jgi:hypothetical protein
LNRKKSIQFQDNEVREGEEIEVVQIINKPVKKDNLTVLIEVNNIDENDKNDYVISNAFL